RVLTAVAHREPDRVPLDFGGRVTTLHVAAERELKQFLGLHGGPETIRSYMTQTTEPDPRLLDMLGRDTDVFSFAPGADYEFVVDPETDTYLDEWGIKYRRPPGGFYYDPAEGPLAFAEEPADLAKYKWPNPTDPARLAGVTEAIKAAHAKGEKAILIGAPSQGLWIQSQFLCGMEKAMMDLAFNPKLSEALAEGLTQWYEQFWDFALGEIGPYVDFVHMEGDLGDQNGPMFSPRSFRDIYKPRLRRVVETIKKRAPQAQMWLHSCGSVYWVIPDLIDVGVEVLNPVQVNAANMDSARLKREFGKDLTFWGGGCDPVLLQFGSPAEVEAEVKHRIDDFAPGGGFVFGSVHNIQINVPPANIVAMFNTAREYGVYE
ncbi:MAG: uroporphyrinogen decarboxylase family protein, partial [Chloroflexota bacterium]